MGLFDSAVLPVACPRCGEVRERELQTKDTDDPCLRVFKRGEEVPDATHLKWLRCIGECTPCPNGDAPPFPTHTIFYVAVLLDDAGCITGETRPLTEDEAG